MIKYPIISTSVSPPLNPTFLTIIGAQRPFSIAQPYGAHPYKCGIQPQVVWQHFVIEALGVTLVAPDVGSCFKLIFSSPKHAPLSYCLFSST